ncbi:hypothetical protein A2T98_03645 [Nodularia spumigena CENA596]|uniref:Uncharacterized protein n=1 Tax=Nodularia spumigena CENA596 TaxID=1819295 RepID=A0A166KII3_NODSP|nr:hypothetical protein [Nodularia spumigena]KZL51179.1 hypothetical protein A2T98_03645 [Nodularia spumigena CENA596]
MATYTDWNQALISYFISGVPRGTKIYLSVDEDVIEHIGYHFINSCIDGNWVDDFNSAVKKRVVVNEQVDLKPLRGLNTQGFPQGVAFLCASVLAASHMGEEEKISEKDYFQRLREILTLRGFRRPAGMTTGSEAEEPLWQEWNFWLMEQGFLPSAQQGKGGPTKYINYPISQCLLRRTDKDKLRQLFQDKKWQGQWDAQTLMVYIRKEISNVGAHLKYLITQNRQRYEAVTEDIHQVYEQWQSQGCPSADQFNNRSFSSHIFCGLYRTENFLEEVEYYLYPKQQRGRQLESVTVKLGDNNQQLIEERPGWYSILDYQVNEKDLEQGNRYKIIEPDNLDYFILPNRDFWILIPDPENPESGVYASWGTPALGTQFIILCKKELLSDIQRLRDENLLQWNGEPEQVFTNSHWVEIQQCMVISQAWDGVFIENQGLKDAIQPSVSLSISLSGGLRVPQIGAWLIDNSPQITIFGFYPIVDLQIIRLSDNVQIVQKSHSTSIPIKIDLSHPGDYLIEASVAGESSQRLVKIVDWQNMNLANNYLHQLININSNYNICGSLIQQNLSDLSKF